jgi:hypothetical protein
MQLCGCDKLIQEIPDWKLVMGEVGRDALISVCVIFFDEKLSGKMLAEKMLIPRGLRMNLSEKK